MPLFSIVLLACGDVPGPEAHRSLINTSGEFDVEGVPDSVGDYHGRARPYRLARFRADGADGAILLTVSTLASMIDTGEWSDSITLHFGDRAISFGKCVSTAPPSDQSARAHGGRLQDIALSYVEGEVGVHVITKEGGRLYLHSHMLRVPAGEVLRCYSRRFAELVAPPGDVWAWATKQANAATPSHYVSFYGIPVAAATSSVEGPIEPTPARLVTHGVTRGEVLTMGVAGGLAVHAFGVLRGGSVPVLAADGAGKSRRNGSMVLVSGADPAVGSGDIAPCLVGGDGSLQWYSLGSLPAAPSALRVLGVVRSVVGGDLAALSCDDEGVVYALQLDPPGVVHERNWYTLGQISVPPGQERAVLSELRGELALALLKDDQFFVWSISKGWASVDELSRAAGGVEELYRESISAFELAIEDAQVDVLNKGNIVLVRNEKGLQDWAGS